MVSRQVGMAALACLALLSFLAAPAACAKHERVLLKDVSAITLSKTGYTTGRRSSPIPQLQCVGGPCQWAPSTVLCSNAGFDGADVLWKCKADLEKGVKLGDISVVCEGFDYPEDPYILRGSCGLEYTLTGQAEVEKQQQRQQYHTGHSGPSNHYSHRTVHAGSHEEESSLGTFFMWALIIGIGYVLYKACLSGGGGGGGGAGGGYPGGYPGGRPPAYQAPPPSYSAADCAPQPAASSGPGFWTGAGLGGALGYMAGSRARSHQQQPSYTATWTDSSHTSESSSGWAPSRPSAGPSSMGTSSSSAFGGTKRR